MRIPRKTLFDFWLDLLLLVAFTLDYSFRYTGLAWHEWVGLIFVVTIPVHLVQHWDWVVRTTRRVFGKRPGRESLRWIVDLLLMPVMVLCVASGILVSRSALPAMGLDMLNDSFFRGLHTSTADITLALVAVHVALSWRWGWTLLRRLARRKAAA